MITVEAPEGITTVSQPRYLPEPSGAQTLPSTLPLKLAPGLFIATVIFISLPVDGIVGDIVTFVMEELAVGVGVGEGEGVGSTNGVGVGVGVGDGVGVGIPIGVGVGVGVGVRVESGAGVGAGAGVGIGVDVDVESGV